MPQEYCQLCQRYFTNLNSIRQHLLDSPAHKRHGFTAESSLQQYNNDTGYGNIRDCQRCSKTFSSPRALEDHQRSTKDCDVCHQKFCYQKALDQHREYNHPVDQFHCCDCNRDFVSDIGLQAHLSTSKKHTTAAREPVLENFCTRCNKQFQSAGAYFKHQTSLIHNPLSKDLKCMFCQKPFAAPSALVMHIESGGCSMSGLTRQKIDEAIFMKDTEGIICNGMVRPQIGRIEPEENDAESVFSTDGGVMFTPSTSGAVTPILTPESGALSPAALYYAPQSALSCRFCPPERGPFMNLRALEQHIASPAHAVKIYHCPTALLGLSSARRSEFSTLSGLTQHLEAGACGKNKKQGEGIFKAAIRFVEGKLKDMGLGDVKLID